MRVSFCANIIESGQAVVCHPQRDTTLYLTQNPATQHVSPLEEINCALENNAKGRKGTVLRLQYVDFGR